MRDVHPLSVEIEVTPEMIEAGMPFLYMIDHELMISEKRHHEEVLTDLFRAMLGAMRGPSREEPLPR